MRLPAVVRRDQYHVITIGEVSKWNFSTFAAACPHRSQHHHWQIGAQLQPPSGGFDKRSFDRCAQLPPHRQKGLAEEDGTTQPPPHFPSPWPAILQVNSLDALDRVSRLHRLILGARAAT